MYHLLFDLLKTLRIVKLLRAMPLLPMKESEFRFRNLDQRADMSLSLYTVFLFISLYFVKT